MSESPEPHRYNGTPEHQTIQHTDGTRTTIVNFPQFNEPKTGKRKRLKKFEKVGTSKG